MHDSADNDSWTGADFMWKVINNSFCFFVDYIYDVYVYNKEWLNEERWFLDYVV